MKRPRIVTALAAVLASALAQAQTPPAAPGGIAAEPEKPNALLLPAVQKVREAATRTGDETSPGERVAPPPTPPAPPSTTPAAGTPGSIASEGDKPAGLLLPAVQKVREAAATPRTDTPAGQRLTPLDVPAPVPAPAANARPDIVVPVGPGGGPAAAARPAPVATPIPAPTNVRPETPVAPVAPVTPVAPLALPSAPVPAPAPAPAPATVAPTLSAPATLAPVPVRR